MSVVAELSRVKKSSQKPAKGQGKRSYKDNLAGHLFLTPWTVGLFGITLFPMAATLYLAFTNYNLLQPPSWTGLTNITRMFGDERLHNSLQVTFTYVFIGVPMQLAVSLAVALLLDRGMRGLPFYRSVFYLPSMLGSSVAIAVLWRQIFGQSGLVNQILAMVGIEGQGWVSSPDTALGTLIILHVWTFGAPMVIFLAGLRQIPDMYYEAAAIDGASKIRQFGTITIPLLTPIIFFNLVMQLISAFQNFTQAFVVSGGTGGPADSTLFYTLYLYQQGFARFDMGYAAAMAWLLVLIIATLTALNFVLAKFWVHYDD
ncbi:carbohydrate ABC transporter permease [Nesterenkonia haasae]|uniref:carbohydrate ABC transporter permease n=1 Tax=Nesterenkonia haasae TaxID=2587813 RepID=UPI001291FEA1|nr:sugar ABC transporter permease [Nesterenkonia haasae]NDK31899.1 sugar ABC transporter permease [Nesterenkonia haasae]